MPRSWDRLLLRNRMAIHRCIRPSPFRARRRPPPSSSGIGRLSDTIANDWQEVQIQNSSGATLAQVMRVYANTRTSTPHASSACAVLFCAKGASIGHASVTAMIIALDGTSNLTTTWSQQRATWTARIDRTAELTERDPFAAEVLRFYKRILEFQKGLFDSRESSNDLTSLPAGNLRRSIDLNEAARTFPEFQKLVQMHGPPKLAAEASRLRDSDPSTVRLLLEKFLAESDPSRDSTSFFARVLLQPQAERLAQAQTPPKEGVAGNRCPYCDSIPQLAVIRPEGDGGKRFLLCSLCQSEWDFRRVLCPVCGETNHEKLPRYTADHIPAVRVEACDTCKTYLKSVDLTVDGLAVPSVDEVATAPLDLWAAERGYTKIQPNLMGF